VLSRAGIDQERRMMVARGIFAERWPWQWGDRYLHGVCADLVEQDERVTDALVVAWRNRDLGPEAALELAAQAYAAAEQRMRGLQLRLEQRRAFQAEFDAELTEPEQALVEALVALRPARWERVMTEVGEAAKVSAAAEGGS
jgi:hypothetical protein